MFVSALAAILMVQAERERQERQDDPGRGMVIEGEVTGHWDEGEDEAWPRVTRQLSDSECLRPLVVLLHEMPRRWGGDEGSCDVNAEHGTSRCRGETP